jgi:hypothetical protein
MSEQAVAAIREMLQPGTVLLVTDSQIAQVPAGRKQVVVSVEENGVLTEIVHGSPGDKAFIPVGGGCGHADAEQLLGSTFVVWLASMPDTTRITYKVVDTVYQAIIQGPDGLWSLVGESADFAALTDQVWHLVTAPGARDRYLDWQILPKPNIQGHPDRYPMQPSEVEVDTDSAPTS